MSLWSSLVERVAGSTIDHLVQQKMQEAATGVLGEDMTGWRRVTRARREEDAYVQEISLDQVYKLYTCNPLAKWLLEMTRDLITAEGVSASSEDPRVHDVIEQFWHHDVNLLDINFPNMVLELGLWGEQCWPAFVPESGRGTVSLGLVPSDMIKEVVHDPENCALPIGVVLKDSTGHPGAKYRIIYAKPDNQIFTPRVQDLRKHEFTDGETFWFKVNTVREATRGLSDLYTLSDWLDGYEELLFNLRDRDADLRAFTWDVTLRGKSDREVQEWLKNTEKPKPGSWFAHNEHLELQAVTPQLNSLDTTHHSRIYRNHITGSMGYPEHWFGGAGDTNRSTANEAHLPTFKRYKQRQRVAKHMLKRVIDYQLRLAAEGGFISGKQRDNYKISMPQMVTEDLTSITASLQQLTASTLQAVDLGWIGADTAQRLFAVLATRLGVDIPTDGVQARSTAQVTPDYRDVDRHLSEALSAAEGNTTEGFSRA